MRFRHLLFIFLGAVNLIYSQCSVIIRGNSLNTYDVRTVRVVIDGFVVVNQASNTISNQILYSHTYTGIPSSVIVSYGSEQSTNNFNTLTEGGYNDIFINTSAYGNIPVTKVFYQTPNTKIFSVENNEGKDVRDIKSTNFCGGELLTVTYNEPLPYRYKEFEFETANGTTLGTAFKESYTTALNFVEYVNYWNYTIAEPTVGGEKRFFRARKKTYDNGVYYTQWTDYQAPITIYNSRPRISLLNTFSTCSNIGFVISVSGAKNVSNDIQYYGLKAYTMEASGPIPIQFSNFSTILRITTNGIYTLTGASFATSLTSGSRVRLYISNYYAGNPDQCSAPDLFFTLPYPTIDASNIVSITKPLKPNGFNLSYHGSNDGEITIIGNNISSIRLESDQTGFYLTKTGNRFWARNVREGTYNVTYSDNLNCASNNYEQPSIIFTSPEQLKLTYKPTPIVNCNGNITSGDFTASIVQVSDNAPPLTTLGYLFNYKIYHGVCCGPPIIDVTVTSSSMRFYNLTSPGDYHLWVYEVGRGNVINNSSVTITIPVAGPLVAIDSLFPNYHGYNIQCPYGYDVAVYTFSGFFWDGIPIQTDVAVDQNGINSWRVTTVAGNTGFLKVTTNNINKGNHTINVNSTYNCPLVKNFSFTGPDPINVAEIKTIIPNTCYGTSNAVLGFTVTGGVGPFNNFSVAYVTNQIVPITKSGQTGPGRAYTFTGLPSGEVYPNNFFMLYLGTDGNGCNYAPAKIFESICPTLITFTGSQSYVTCKGDRNGSVFPVSISGGNGQYFGKIYNSSFDSIPTGGQAYANNLPEDLYRIYVKDQKGCTVTGGYLTATVTGPALPLTITALGAVTQPSCYQSNNGELYFNVTGGWPGTYAYQTLPNGHTNRGQTLTSNNTLPLKISNASRGNYITSVTDSKGCTRSISSYLPSPDSMIVSVLNSRQPNCFGENNGQVTLTVTGGSGIYRYSTLNNGIYKTNPVKDTLSAGTYTLSAKDNKNCLSGSATFVLNEPVRLRAIIMDTLAAACHQSIGAVTLIGTGGTTPYQISWKDSITYTAFRRDKMKSGIYGFYIKDSHNCSDSSTVALRDADGPKIINSTLLSPACSYSSDGRIKVMVEEGSRPFTYDWSGGGAFQDSTAFNLAGNRTYSVLVTDKNNCKGGMDFNLMAPSPLSMKVKNLHDPLCFGNNDGSIELISEGGSVPYQYLTSEGAAQSSNKISGLRAGVYQLITRDNNNCTVTGQAGLSEPDSYSFSFYPDNATVCPGQKYKLQSPVTSASYQWSGPNGFTASTEKITTDKQGTYSLTVFNEKGCTATDDYLITESTSVLEANFLVKGEVSVGDTLVIVELSWPKPENISWNLPTQFTVVKTENEYAYVIPTEPGNYDISLEAALGDCSNERTKTVKIIARDQAKKEDFTAEYLGPKLLYVYPNPAEGELNIYLEFGSETDVFIQVLDLSGTEVVRTQSLSGKSIYQKKLETSLLSSGMYIVKVNSPDYQRVLKFIKI